MFDAWCPRERSRVLLTSRRIERIVQDGGRIDVHFRCWCGARGVWRTGKQRHGDGQREAA